MMENSSSDSNGNGATDNGHIFARHSYQPSLKASLPWLDIRVFYLTICKCELDDSTPEVLTLNHVPLNHDTLLEINGVRTSIYSDDGPALLKRGRMDRKSEEATFVSTDSIRMTGSVKFEVFDKDVLLLSGVLELCNGNDFVGESSHNAKGWSMKCESAIIPGTSFLKGKQFMVVDSTSPMIEVYIAGSFLGTPIILTRTLQLGSQKKHTRKGMLDAIPENEASENQKHVYSALALQDSLALTIKSFETLDDLMLPKESECLNKKLEDVDYNNLYSRTTYVAGEDGELSWFNAGVRVGVGIGLSICIGVSIGVGLLVKTYQGTTCNFKRRLL